MAKSSKGFSEKDLAKLQSNVRQPSQAPAITKLPKVKAVKVVSPKQQMEIVSGKENEALICVTINKKASYAEYRDDSAQIIFTYEGIDYVLECRRR